MPFKPIFFDAAGTLMRPVRPVGESYALIAAGHGMSVPAAEISTRFRACFGSAPPLAFPDAGSGEIQALERAWWKETVRRGFAPYRRFARHDDFFTAPFAYFCRAGPRRLLPQ